jgi:hypothetical protein
VRWVPEIKKWRLENVRIFDFTNSQSGIRTLATLDTSLALFPKDFENQHMLNERLTNAELTEKIEMLQFRGADNVETFLVERYLRGTYPFSIVILTLIGVILSARKSREGSGLKIALGICLHSFSHYQQNYCTGWKPGSTFGLLASQSHFFRNRFISLPNGTSVNYEFKEIPNYSIILPWHIALS